MAMKRKPKRPKCPRCASVRIFQLGKEWLCRVCDKRWVEDKPTQSKRRNNLMGRSMERAWPSANPRSTAGLVAGKSPAICHPKSNRRNLSKAIADMLFDDDDGKKIEYLVRFRSNGVSIGRWRQPDVAQRIKKLLRRTTQKP